MFTITAATAARLRVYRDRLHTIYARCVVAPPCGEAPADRHYPRIRAARHVVAAGRSFTTPPPPDRRPRGRDC